jgi:hypothetical protein
MALTVIGRVAAKPAATPYQFAQQPTQYEQAHETSSVRAVAAIQGAHFKIVRSTVELNAHGAADSADVTLPLSSSPDFTRMFKNIAWVPIQVYLGIYQQPPPAHADLSIAGKTQLFSGSIDVNSMSFADDTITFKCRSLASLLIDNRITHIPRNMNTATGPKNFVTQIAEQYGLTANIVLPSKQYQLTVAEVFAHDFAVGIQNSRIFDLLIKMAEIDGADVWVTGRTLNYANPGLIKRNTIDIKYGRDIETLTVEHSASSKNIRVEVRTYNPHTRVSTVQRRESGDPANGVTVTSSSRVVVSNPQFGSGTQSTTSYSSTGAITNTTSSSSGGVRQTVATRGPDNVNGPLIYKIYKPGLSPEAADALSESTRQRLAMQLYTANIRIPLSRSRYQQLSITSLIRLHGIPMQVPNDTVFPRKITFSIDPDSPGIDIETSSIALPEGQV